MSQASLPRFLTRKGVPLWRDVVVLKWVAQILSAVLVVGFLAFFISNVLKAAEARGLGLGYGFLDDSAGFPVAESVIPYDPSRSFGYALLVGLLNTLKVSLVGIVLATFLGLAAALARLSSNWLVSTLAGTYINIIRNVPLLVQLFIWYFAVFQQLPAVKDAFSLPGPIFLSQRGLYMVGARPTGTFLQWAVFVVAGVVLAGLVHRVLIRIQLDTGRTTYPLATASAVLFLLSLIHI